jgi:hypothetical protein
MAGTSVDLQLHKLDGALSIITTIGAALAGLIGGIPMRRRHHDDEGERSWPGDGPALPGEPAEDYHVPEPYEPEEAPPPPPGEVAAADTQGMGEGG